MSFTVKSASHKYEAAFVENVEYSNSRNERVVYVGAVGDPGSMFRFKESNCI